VKLKNSRGSYNPPRKETAHCPNSEPSKNQKAAQDSQARNHVKPRRNIEWRCSGITGQPRYGCGSKASAAIKSTLIRELADLDKLDEGQLEHLRDVLADGLCFVMLEQEKRHSHIDAQFQMFEYREVCRDDVGSFEVQTRPRWADHGEEWTNKKSRSVACVGHPYHLGTSDLRELLRLSEIGYDVRIDGSSHHFPGSSVRVVVALSDKKGGDL
jgi:hypothetical protein